MSHCYICLEDLSTPYYPCSCRFTPSHRECCLQFSLSSRRDACQFCHETYSFNLITLFGYSFKRSTLAVSLSWFLYGVFNWATNPSNDTFIAAFLTFFIDTIIRDILFYKSPISEVLSPTAVLKGYMVEVILLTLFKKAVSFVFAS